MMLDKKTVNATLILIGTIIGAGIFALPYIIFKSGILPGIFYFVFLGAIVLLLHLLYGEMVLRTKSNCRIVGFAEKYLGKGGKFIVLISVLVSICGSTLVYLILGSTFLQIIIPISQLKILYVLFFWFLMSIFIITDWKKAAVFNSLMTGLLILAVLIIIFYGASRINLANISTINWSYLFLPWGAIFYSLSGGPVIPEMREVIGGQTKNLKKAIIIGSLIPVLIYFLFCFVIIGVVGKDITQEAIISLGPFLGRGIVYVGAIFGFLNIATSYLVLEIVFKKILIYDLKTNRFVATTLVCLFPLFLYLLGFYNFIQIVIFLGLWLGAVDGILMLVMHKRAQVLGDREPEYSLKIPNIVYLLIGVIFISALIFKLISKN